MIRPTSTRPAVAGGEARGSRRKPAPRPATPPLVGSLAVSGGAWPAADANAVLVERGAAQSLGVTPGSSATVVGGGGSLDLHVAGVVRDISRAPYPLSTPAVVYVTQSVGTSLGGAAPSP